MSAGSSAFINVVSARVTAGCTWPFIAAKVERESIFKFAIAVPPMPPVSAVHQAILRGPGNETRDHEIWCSRLIRVFWRVVGIVRAVSRD
jgi:hypothetical protein